MKQLCWILLFSLAQGAGCHRVSEAEGSDEGDSGSDSDTDADSDTDSDSDADEYPADGVDLLIVVDNSGSMKDEQELLAQHAFELVGELAAEVDSVRVAVVSTDMGLQWGGNPYENGDGWPGDTPIGCGSVGDNGEFQTYGSGKTITLDDEVYDCPSLAATWAETPLGDPPEDNPDLPGQAACLSALGTNGCGWEQQLQAMAVGVNKPSQAAFHSEDHLLAAIVVSDEDDCSIESDQLFAVDEVQHLADGRVNVACGNHMQYLYPAVYFRNQLAAPKGGNPNAVLFAAIVGVPPGEACEGRGDEIPDCWDQADMQLVEVIENDAYFFRPACERWEGETQVTKARPGRRFVETAWAHQENGYVASICNADWSDAVDGIAQMIHDELND